jgi:hypothetical protein
MDLHTDSVPQAVAEMAGITMGRKEIPYHSVHFFPRDSRFDSMDAHLLAFCHPFINFPLP